MSKILGSLPRGLVFVISAPAGTGKTTLVRMLRDEFAVALDGEAGRLGEYLCEVDLVAGELELHIGRVRVRAALLAAGISEAMNLTAFGIAGAVGPGAVLVALSVRAGRLRRVRSED